MSYRALFWLIFIGFGFVWSNPAMAVRGLPCNSCQNCTEALGLPNARVHLVDDLVHEGEGPCITIKGVHAQFDGLEREIRPLKKEGTVGILIQAPNTLVKNIHVIGAETGVEVESSRYATLFHLWLENNQTGIRVGPSVGTRITRSIISGGSVGVDIGGGIDGLCSEAEQEKRTALGTVVVGTHIEGQKTGIIACHDTPHLKNNTVIRNDIGVVMKRPRMLPEKSKSEGPYDSCACAPTMPGITPGTTMFYSSGCNGCKVHEEWLPDLRSNGADINLRVSGPGTQEEAKIFDGHMDRCAPQITDVLGIPGCVPNYVCIASDETLKVRAGEDQMVYETQIQNAEMLATYAENCQTSAKALYKPGEDCVKHVAANNLFCGNKILDFEGSSQLAGWPGFNNTCTNTKEFQDEGKEGCTSTCSELPQMPTKPDARITKIKNPIPPSIAQSAGNIKVEKPVMDMASLLKDNKTEDKVPEETNAEKSEVESQDTGEGDESPSPGVILIILVIISGGLYSLSRSKKE